MTRPSHDPSIEHEPHLRDAMFDADPSEQLADRILQDAAGRSASGEAPDHSVWDEPSLSPELVGSAGIDQATYARWLEGKIAETSSVKSWLMTLAVVLVAGPWGVLGALFGGVEGSSSAFAMYAIIGPVTEEIMKIAAALWIVEKRPYLFKSVWQILLCAAAGGAAFAYIENLVYLNVYLPDPSSQLVMWRWTVCSGLHTTWSFIAGVGLARIWDNAIRNRHPPQLGLGVSWFVLAMAGHGMYNGFVVFAERFGWLDF
jgi:hypothetical protein